MESNESSYHRREEGIFLCLIGFLVSSEFLVTDGHSKTREIPFSLWLLAPTKVAIKPPTNLPELCAVALVEDPLSAVGTVGNIVVHDKLGIEHLPCSLRGHLADDDRPLEVHLLTWKKIGFRLSFSHTHTDTHTHAHKPESSWSCPLCSMRCICPGCLTLQDGAPSILHRVEKNGDYSHKLAYGVKQRAQ